ncbi:twin-arginine translocation signal domain-containing protein [Chelativorans alearense]|uniref:twin-arginine translocation signal domain-containing protein n=1 Tax=Chelativorans alearense TaxID=2681495 RepID=UPI0013D82B06|nr:twin-arginine translocation signal domain-containing protein [Chelativorans alearense]
MHDKQQTAINRRNFLRAAGGASTVAVATAAATLNPDEAQAYNPGEEEMGPRYQETDHVKAFYRVNGYETLEK